MTDLKEYIEREALISICEQIISDDWNRRTAPESWADAYECFMEDVKDQPAADVAEVVRCKDCKYLMFSDCYGECRLNHLRHDVLTTASVGARLWRNKRCGIKFSAT